MTVDFRCENCGKMLSVDAEPGSSTRCPHCKKTTPVPEALASLPRPQVPPNAAPQPRPEAPAPADDLSAQGESSDAMLNVMARLMPVVVSVFFHLGVALVCMFLTMVVVKHVEADKIVIPESSVLTADITHVGGGGLNPTRGGGGGRGPTDAKVGASDQRDSTIPMESSGANKGVIIGREGAAGSSWSMVSSGGDGTGTGTGRGLMGGSGSGRGGGGGPRSAFIGEGGYAHHIVYVIDRSGSMSDTFEAVRNEMITSISRLQDIQDFHVIMFADGPPIENPPRKLVSGNRENKDAVLKFLNDVVAQGKTDPVPALNRAFDVMERANTRPGKLVYLLTDGDFPDNEKVLSALRARNRSKDVHINTYLYAAKPLSQAEKVMTQIASENGGKYKFQSTDD